MDSHVRHGETFWHHSARYGARLMAFEAAFGVTAALFVIFALLYVRSRKAKDDLVRSNIRLTTELEAVKERGHDLPAIVKNLSAEVLKEHTESFKTTTTDPMGKTMEDLRTHIEELGKQNAGDREAFDTSMKHMATATDKLMKDTKTLSDVLKSSQRRGRHAEMGLERVFEMSNLTKGIHYDTQYVSGDGKPDFVVNLSEDRSIIVDSKAPLNSLWEAFDTDDEATKSDALNRHATAVRNHANSLSKKEYWDSPKSSLDYVVMVMPEYALLPALDRDGGLIEYALAKRVVLVTPSTLMILLRAVGLMWKQSQMASTVKEIGALSADLHTRLSKFADHYNKTGKGLEDAVRRYNDGIGSWSRRVLPAANKLAEAGAVAGDMTNLKPVEDAPGRLPIDEDDSA